MGARQARARGPKIALAASGMPMSRVGGIGGNVAVGARGRSAASQGGVFGVETEAPAVEDAGQAQAAQPVGLASLLALQEADSDAADSRKGKRYGLAVLEALRDLQHELLSPHGGEVATATLAALAKAAPPAADAGLEGVLSAIRMRAKIELMRRGVESD